MFKRTSLGQYAVTWRTLVLGILCSTALTAQPVTTFERTYADPTQTINTDGIYGMDQTVDDGYIMVGTETFGNPGGTHLIRTDLNGGNLWNTLYTDLSWDEDYSVIQSIQGTPPANDLYWSTGIVDWYGHYGLWHFHLTSVSPAGVTNWTRHYVPRFGLNEQDLLWSGSTSVIELSNGEIVQAGWAGLNGGTAGRFHIVKTTAAGAIVWAALYGNDQGSDDRAWCVRELPDGNLLVVGTGNRGMLGNTPIGDVMWMKLNAATGATMWGPNPVKLFSINNEFCAGYSVAIDAGSNQAIIVGEHQYPGFGGGIVQDGLIVAVNLANGSLNSYVTYDFSSSGNAVDIFRSVCPGTINRSVTIVGKTGDAFGERALALKIETGGLTPFWVHTYDANGLEWGEFRHVDQVRYPQEPNAYAAAGEINDPAWWVNEYLARISPLNGQTGCEYTPDIELDYPAAEFLEVPVFDPCDGNWLYPPQPPQQGQCHISDDFKPLAEANPGLNDPYRCGPFTAFQKRNVGQPVETAGAAMNLKVLPSTLNRGETFAVFFNSAEGSDCKVVVSDLLGNTMFEKQLQAGSLAELTVNTQGWSAGIYTLSVSRNDGDVQTAKLVVY